jgi:hypothetical protein
MKAKLAAPEAKSAAEQRSHERSDSSAKRQIILENCTAKHTSEYRPGYCSYPYAYRTPVSHALTLFLLSGFSYEENGLLGCL